MEKQKHILFTVVAVLVMCGAVQANITLNVVPAFAPNQFGSPNWDTYVGNAINSLRGVGPTATDRSDNPAAYVTVGAGKLDPKETVVTGFPSWRGVADPASPFNQEKGNRIYFGLAATTPRQPGNLTFFSLFDIDYERRWLDLPGETESTRVIGPTLVGDFTGTTETYNLRRVGVQYDSNDPTDSSKDTLVTTGPATQQVNQLFLTGVGMALLGDTTGGATNQGNIDATLDNFLNGAQQRVLGRYNIASTGQSASGYVDFVPEPGSAGLTWLAICAMLWSFHRRM